MSRVLAKVEIPATLGILRPGGGWVQAWMSLNNQHWAFVVTEGATTWEVVANEAKPRVEVTVFN